MKRFLYIAEGGRLNYLDCTSAEMVYRGVCCFYKPSTKVIVIDTKTNEASIFTRTIDKNGNLVCIFENGIEK
jgi:hypothetical protein